MLGISFTSTPGLRVQKQFFISERAVRKLPLNTKKSSRSRDYYPVRACAARGRVIVLSVSRFVCLFVCLSAPTQDFEQNRLVYGLYLLRMSQKLKNINLYLPHERERTFTFLGFVKTTF